MPDRDLIELVYSSRSIKQMEIDEVRALLTQAREKNRREGVTGLLCYDGQKFLQIIEGQSDVILDLFHAIQNDSRHEDVQILHDGDIKARAFSDWKMAYEPIPSGMLPALGRSIARASLAGALGEERAISENLEPMSAGQRIFDLVMDDIYSEHSEPA